MRRWISAGFKPNFSVLPKALRLKNYNWNEETFQEWPKIREKWLANGVIEPIKKEQAMVISPLYLKKEATKFRPIWDGRYVNQYITVPRIKYETLRDVRLMVSRGCKTIAFDLERGYHAISIAPEWRKYFTFEV